MTLVCMTLLEEGVCVLQNCQGYDMFVLKIFLH